MYRLDTGQRRIGYGSVPAMTTRDPKTRALAELEKARLYRDKIADQLRAAEDALTDKVAEAINSGVQIVEMEEALNMKRPNISRKWLGPDGPLTVETDRRAARRRDA